MVNSELHLTGTTEGKGMAREEPALWREGAPEHFDLWVPWWVKGVAVAGCVVLSMWLLDARIAGWAMATHPIPDLADRAARQGDTARELMLLEQWGQWVTSVVVIFGVFLLDKAGRRRALAIAVGCVATLMVSYLLKDLTGRSRPMLGPELGLPAGSWVWGGPLKGFRGGAIWTSFPSAHTTGAFALSAGLAWFYPRGRLLFMGLACITAGLRVMHRAHFLSDVIAGMGIAVFVTRWTLQRNIAGRMIGQMHGHLRRWWLA